MQLAACIAILKSARQLGLVEDLGHVSSSAGDSVEIPARVYYRAICHASEELQTEAMQLICTYPKVTALPSKSCLLSLASIFCSMLYLCVGQFGFLGP